ncbi:MAG TPA: hypothetical protein VGH43_17810 [Jatrophihabitans sp.]
MVPLPLARFAGAYTVGGRTIDTRRWIGSQNHNWGREHTAAELTVRDRRSGQSEVLRTHNRALFEILTDDIDHGIAIRA